MGVVAETGIDAWLRYALLPTGIAQRCRKHTAIVASPQNTDCPVATAARELQTGLMGILGQEVRLVANVPQDKNGLIVLAVRQPHHTDDSTSFPHLKEDGFRIDFDEASVNIVGGSNKGVLYGAFHYLSRLSRADFEESTFASNPSATLRYTNHWDNLDDLGEHGSIERGYGGPSIFFKDGFVREDLGRVTQLARLLSSVGINGAFINNVNAGAELLNDRNLRGIKRIADLMRPYGVQIGLSLFFDTPRALGGLPTSDPVDEMVVNWWTSMTEKIYEHVPDLLGYLIKANSEGQPGPLTYGRTLAEGANMFARALKTCGDGIVMYRAFVYDHHLEESNLKNDRANAAVDFFQHLDGHFDDNVTVQIKFGPIDFQVREPPSPLLAALQRTDVVIEFMVAQEYLGQQSHYAYQAPLWKTILDFDFVVDGRRSIVGCDILSGKRFGRNRNGYAAVVNVGMDNTWLGHHLSMSNLYAYGRLAWNPSLDEKTLLQEWIQLTFGLDEQVLRTLTNIGMQSWPAYEAYSGNLGIQTLCDIIYTHFGPDPARMDGNGWGQWTRASHKSIGMDRTLQTGTGNTHQYPAKVAQRFENIQTTPDELLLWFHHVPYTHTLKSTGKTVIQHFYDEHYRGASEAQAFSSQFNQLKGLIDQARFEHVAFKLNYQAGHSLVWRDSVCRFYHNLSGIADEQGRVGHYQWRIPAHVMKLVDYEIISVCPPEAASLGKAIHVRNGFLCGSAVIALDTLDPGTYDVAINYYDHLGGMSRYELYIDDKLVGEWKGDLQTKLGHAFSKHLDGHSATRIYFRGIHIDQGAVLRIVGRIGGKERAPLDYVSILPPNTID